VSSCLFSKNINDKIYKTILLPAVLYRCETWTLTLRDEHRQKVFEERLLDRGEAAGPKRNEIIGGWAISIMRISVTCTVSQL
jgi:hypothetical protein